MVFVVLCSGTPEGSTGSGSGFKASQKTGQWLKVSSDRLGEAQGGGGGTLIFSAYVGSDPAPALHPINISGTSSTPNNI